MQELLQSGFGCHVGVYTERRIESARARGMLNVTVEMTKDSLNR